jgi:hypothetical protein
MPVNAATSSESKLKSTKSFYEVDFLPVTCRNLFAVTRDLHGSVRIDAVQGGPL